jgi:hypothetical protein
MNALRSKLENGGGLFDGAASNTGLVAQSNRLCGEAFWGSPMPNDIHLSIIDFNFCIVLKAALAESNSIALKAARKPVRRDEVVFDPTSINADTLFPWAGVRDHKVKAAVVENLLIAFIQVPGAPDSKRIRPDIIHHDDVTVGRNDVTRM